MVWTADVAQVMKRLSSEKRSRTRFSINSFRRMKDVMCALDQELQRTKQNVAEVISNVKHLQARGWNDITQQLN